MLYQKIKRLKKVKETFANRTRKEAIVLPDGRFNILYADMALLPEDIDAIKDKTADKAILFLMATPHQLPEALAFMTSLNFDYKDCAVCIKKDMLSGGKCFTAKHTHLLIGTKNDYDAPDRRTPSVHHQIEFGDASDVE